MEQARSPYSLGPDSKCRMNVECLPTDFKADFWDFEVKELFAWNRTAWIQKQRQSNRERMNIHSMESTSVCIKNVFPHFTMCHSSTLACSFGSQTANAVFVTAVPTSPPNPTTYTNSKHNVLGFACVWCQRRFFLLFGIFVILSLYFKNKRMLYTATG